MLWYKYHEEGDGGVANTLEGLPEAQTTTMANSVRGSREGWRGRMGWAAVGFLDSASLTASEERNTTGQCKLQAGERQREREA